MLSVTGQAMAGGRAGLSADGTKKVIRTVVVVRGARDCQEPRGRRPSRHDSISITGTGQFIQ